MLRCAAADHTDYAFALDHPAIFAARLDRRMHLHRIPLYNPRITRLSANNIVRVYPRSFVDSTANESNFMRSINTHIHRPAFTTGSALLFFHSLAIAINDSSPRQVIWRQLNQHAIAFRDTNVVHSHFTRDMG